MASDGAATAAAVSILILYIHLDISVRLFSLFLAFPMTVISGLLFQTTTNEIEGAPTRCFGCRSSPSGDEDWGRSCADVFVTAHSVVAEIGFDSVVFYSVVATTTATATTGTTTAAASAAAAATSSTVVDCVGGSGRHGSADQRDGVDEPIVFQRRRRPSAVSPIRTQGSQIPRNDAVSQEEGDMHRPSASEHVTSIPPILFRSLTIAFFLLFLFFDPFFLFWPCC